MRCEGREMVAMEFKILVGGNLAGVCEIGEGEGYEV